MNRIVRWFYATELRARDDAAYHRGYMASSQDMLEALRREKVFLFGEGPVQGLNEFLASSVGKNATVIGCHFGDLNELPPPWAQPEPAPPWETGL